MPANTFPDQGSLGFITAVVATTSMDNNTAYNIVKALLGNLKNLRARTKGLRNFDPAKTG